MEKKRGMNQDIGLIGLAVMGQNLVLNMNDCGFAVSVFNRTASKVDEFLSGSAKDTKIQGYSDLPSFFASLKRPRKVMFMVKAGAPVDDLIQQTSLFLEPGDIIIDGGNSHFTDTARRQKLVEEKGLLYLGVGVSGGEEGARHGPSIMPGGSQAAWESVRPIFQAISAKVEGSSGLEACCEWIGGGGSGHFVKMVHNGIEYGDMQLIAETYDLLKRGAQCSNDEMQSIFAEWNRGRLESYLIEITEKILGKKERSASGKEEHLLDLILDVAEQKGTGKWVAAVALDAGTPLTLITESVFARYLSSMKDERVKASAILGSKIASLPYPKEFIIQIAEKALYAAKIMSYAQGFMLMSKVSKEYGWECNIGSCALMWRGGCIIRSMFLGKVKEAFDLNPNLDLLILDPYFSQEIQDALPSLRKIVSIAALAGIPVPCLSSALNFYDGIRSHDLPTNLTQAQRDFFGAHTFERIDRPRGEYFHTEWYSK
ncbi:MAG: decarboxylating NADP(+)-dependent phosphogluconate dehydrogenase [Chlamydia sp.]